MAAAVKIKQKGHISEGNPVWTVVLYILAILAALICIYPMYYVLCMSVSSPAAVSGLQPVQRACVSAAVALGTGRPAVFVCGDEREAQLLAGDLRTLTDKEPVVLLSREWQFRPGSISSRAT